MTLTLNSEVSMFGLIDKNKKKEEDKEYLLDLEVELKEEAARSAFEKKIMDRISKIKGELRGGIEKESFEKLGVVLFGYVSLLKVVSVIGAKKKK